MLKEFLAVSTVLLMKNSKVANAWETQFLMEQVKALESGKQLSGPVQFHIEKVYKSIVKRSQGHTVDVSKAISLTFKTSPAPFAVNLKVLYRMIAPIVEVLKIDRSRFSDEDISLFRVLVTKLKKGEEITEQEYLQFQACYNNVINRELTTV